jgi:hypothetical protein
VARARSQIDRRTIEALAKLQEKLAEPDFRANLVADFGGTLKGNDINSSDIPASVRRSLDDLTHDELMLLSLATNYFTNRGMNTGTRFGRVFFL